MSEPTPSEIQAEALRLQRLLDETLDRHAGRPEAERIDAAAEALRGELAAAPVAVRTGLLAELRTLVGDAVPVAAATPGGDGAALRTEVARLRAALADAEARPAAAGSSGDLAAQLAALLLGPKREADWAAAAPGAEERLLGVVRLLAAFATDIGASFLGLTADPNQTMTSRVRSALAQEVLGRGAPGAFEALTIQVRRRIQATLIAFKRSCEDGADNLLRQLSPQAIAAGTSRDSSRIFGARPFYHRECWEAFERRWTELRDADDLYEVYFEGAFKKAMHEASRAPGAKGDDRGGER